MLEWVFGGWWVGQGGGRGRDGAGRGGLRDSRLHIREASYKALGVRGGAWEGAGGGDGGRGEEEGRGWVAKRRLVCACQCIIGFRPGVDTCSPTRGALSPLYGAARGGGVSGTVTVTVIGSTTHKGARGSWGTRGETRHLQNCVKGVKNNISFTLRVEQCQC